MDAMDVITKAREGMSQRTVFGEPVTHEDLIVIPVARVSGGAHQRLEVEHPTGSFTVDMEVVVKGGDVEVKRSALLRTARKLMRGEVFVPGHVWRRG